MSNVISGSGGGPWLGDFDVPWLCPDGGICQHECDMAACFRVHNSAPLTGVFPGEPAGRWPVEITENYRPGGRY